MPESELPSVQTPEAVSATRVPASALLVDSGARRAQQQAELKLVFMRAKQATIERRVSAEKMRRRALAALAGGGAAIGVKALLKLIFGGRP